MISDHCTYDTIRYDRRVERGLKSWAREPISPHLLSAQ